MVCSAHKTFNVLHVLLVPAGINTAHTHINSWQIACNKGVNNFDPVRPHVHLHLEKKQSTAPAHLPRHVVQVMWRMRTVVSACTT